VGGYTLAERQCGIGLRRAGDSMKLVNPIKFAEACLDTLAENRTQFNQNSDNKPFVIVNGEGSDIHDGEALAGRAKRKIITQRLVLSLVDVARKKGKLEQVKSYWNTYHCQNQLFSNGGFYYGRYCKNRFCTLCCSIRKATIMNQYLPIVETWEDCHFLTLTIRAIPAKELSRYCAGMLKEFGKMLQKYRKRTSRRGGNNLQGLKSWECNFNPQRRTYNPHFHVLVRNREMAEILRNEWLSRIPLHHADPRAQFIRKVDDKERDLIEVVKYGSKIFTELDNKRRYVKASPYVYVSALDNIFTAMMGHRIFDRFGFNLPDEFKAKSSGQFKVLTQFDEWLYSPFAADWVSRETGAALSNYKIGSDLISILDNNLDLFRQ
jgi:Replication protein